MNIKKLSIILVVVVGVLIVVRLFKDDGRSEGFESDLIRLDTAAVSRILIESPSDTVDLSQTETGWQAKLDNGKLVPVVLGNIKTTLETLLTIKPSRIVSKSPDKWAEYQVDSEKGTRLRVFQDGDQVVDLVIGTIGFLQNDQQAANPYQQQRQRFFSYARLYGDNSVYVCEDFLSFNISKETKQYRDNRLLNLTIDSIEQISFVYPADSGFTLQQTEKTWTLDGQIIPTDTVKQVLEEITALSSTNFEDAWLPDGQNATHTILVQSRNQPNQELKVFDNLGQLIFYSSLNPSNYFKDLDNNLAQKLLVSQTQFLK